MSNCDFELLRQADEDSELGIRGFLRTSRRIVKRCFIDRACINRQRIFCQNIGACGSTYLIQLLRDNGIKDAYHEKKPDLNELGVEHFETPGSSHRIVRILRYTRHNVFFEANNRFFSLSKELAIAFPNAKFIHLFRSPIESVRSGMSKCNVVPYLQENVRLRSSVGGPSGGTPFEKFCHHWRIANQRIHDDLKSIAEKNQQPYLTLDFLDLVAGKLDEFESFTGIRLSQRVRPPVNQRPTRPEGKYPEYNQWSAQERKTLEEICGELWETLKSK